jgi:DnaJ-class molecular chaperone
MKTLYHVLGVPFDAIGSQIDGAYRSECAKLDAEALDGETRAGRRRSLDHAHQTLTNSLARMEYDEKLIKLKAMKAPQPAFGSAASSESVWCA